MTDLVIRFLISNHCTQYSSCRFCQIMIYGTFDDPGFTAI